MIKLTKKEIDKILPLIEKGLNKYLLIQSYFEKHNVAVDKAFWSFFNTFYRITPKRDLAWQKVFYNLLENTKNKKVVLRNVLVDLEKIEGKLEASFASKLCATINPHIPVIDSVVFKNLRDMGNGDMRLPYSYVNKEERIQKIDDLYTKLQTFFKDFLKTSEGKYLVIEFKKMYPYAKITSEKMLDLVLWQKR